MGCAPDDHLKVAYEIFSYLLSSESPDNHYPKPILDEMKAFCINFDTMESLSSVA